jgi:hypothetical protein
VSDRDDVRYLLDRLEIQDKIALYGFGQDLHQAGAADKNILEEWSQIFAPEVQIDLHSLGLRVFNLHDYAELMRGPGLRGGGLENNFKAWQHIEGQARVTIDGDTATSVALHFHTHEHRDGKQNLFDLGYWHDNWERRADGWFIVRRRHQSLYTNTFAVIPNPAFLEE